MKIGDLKNKKIAVLGFGLEGKSSLKFLENIGVEDITLLDKSPIKSSNHKMISGENYLDNLGDFDVIFKTPGISPYHEKILPYREKLTSQVEIFFANYNGKVIGITATKGKSTTVSLLYEVLKKSGFDTKLVGNIGNPVLDEVNILSNEKYDYIVYEMSSYMLEGFCPNLYIGVLGNIFRCHVDWHNNDYEVYKKAKLNILRKSQNIAVNHNLKDYVDVSLGSLNNITYFGLEGDSRYNSPIFILKSDVLFSDENMILKGEHNRINTSSVIAILSIIANDTSKNILELTKNLETVLSQFGTLDHRLQEIGTINGITFVDDSISTTPDSTIEAIKTYSPKIGTILLGGFDYGFEFSEFASHFKKYKILNVVFFPDTGKDIKDELVKAGCILNFIETNSMQEAINFAYKHTKSGEVVLLSCASPSFSMYKNYKERGYDFKKQMLNHKKGK